MMDEKNPREPQPEQPDPSDIDDEDVDKDAETVIDDGEAEQPKDGEGT